MRLIKDKIYLILLAIILGLLMLVDCSSSKNDCCNIKVGSINDSLCIDENLRISNKLKTFIKMMPDVEWYYDEGLDSYYSKCKGDRSFHKEDSFILEKKKFYQSNEYTFCDSVLVRSKFSFKVYSIISEGAFLKLLVERYPCLKSKYKKKSPFFDVYYDIGRYDSDTLKSSHVDIEIGVL